MLSSLQPRGLTRWRVRRDYITSLCPISSLSLILLSEHTIIATRQSPKMSMSMLPNVNATAGAAVDGALFIEVAQRWPVAATALFACAVAYLLQAVLKSDPWADIPMVGTEFGGSEARRKQFMNGEARNLYLNGYRKVRQTPASPNGDHYELTGHAHSSKRELSGSPPQGVSSSPSIAKITCTKSPQNRQILSSPRNS